ncbi:hypothetical protein [Hespellia stercorisuis]|uniref:Uncharacterized protein n=1 Tax=Hespellia stercorisuis DSM 15480 TaxID=1121950 RepID=A0A1M6W587_9FIRM|nr:hypothetical protein [Hespellia stercorisuis]SHK88922.1 hypothetical protein SAMN02745243_03937 [Hespellia stercorisuis DSM 15480]
MRGIEKDLFINLATHVIINSSGILSSESAVCVEFAEKQFEFFTNIEQYIINLKCKKKELHSKIEEILEYIESTHYNVAQGYEIYKMLRECRIKRKEKMKKA